LKTRDARKIDKEVDAVLKYLKQQCHAQKIGAVGFCWGGVAVHHVMMKYPEFRAGVSVYGKSALHILHSGNRRSARVTATSLFPS